MQIKTYISLLQVLIVVLENDVKKKSVLKKKSGSSLLYLDRYVA